MNNTYIKNRVHLYIIRNLDIHHCTYTNVVNSIHVCQVNVNIIELLSM